LFFLMCNTTLPLLERLGHTIRGKVEDLLALLLIAETKGSILEGILGCHLSLLLLQGVHLQPEGFLAPGEELQLAPYGTRMEVSFLAKQTKKDEICYYNAQDEDYV